MRCAAGVADRAIATGIQQSVTAPAGLFSVLFAYSQYNILEISYRSLYCELERIFPKSGVLQIRGDNKRSPPCADKPIGTEMNRSILTVPSRIHYSERALRSKKGDHPSEILIFAGFRKFF